MATLGRVADVRITAFLFVVLAHAALIAWIATARRTLPSAEEREQRSVLVFLPDKTRLEPEPQSAAERASREPRLLPIPVRPPEPLRIAPSPEPSTPRESQAPPPVDWHQQAGISARHQTDEMIHSEEATGAGPGGTAVQPANPRRPKPEFHGDRAHTHRVEAIEGGGILVRLNERCALVITLLAVPVCQVGKIPARGDLFEHMADAPQAGDWNENSAAAASPP